MNGKVFEVTDAEQIVRETEGNESPDGVRSSHPWVSMDPNRARAGKDALFVQRPGQARQYLAGSKVSQRPDGTWGSKGTLSSTSAKQTGVLLPPYHWRCRSDVIVSQRATKDFLKTEKLREEYGVEKPMFTTRVPKGSRSGVSVLSNAALIPAVVPSSKAVADQAYLASRLEELGLPKRSAAALSRNTAGLKNAEMLTRDLLDDLGSVTLAKRELDAAGASADYAIRSKAIRVSGPNGSYFVHEVGHHRWHADELLKHAAPLNVKARKAFVASKKRVRQKVDAAAARATGVKKKQLTGLSARLKKIETHKGVGLGEAQREILKKVGGVPVHTNYAMADMSEFWAEGFMMYFQNPQRLQKTSPELFSAIREYLGQ
jgi:hypothetical protein